jgi:GTPase SAR1 family protein
LAKQPTTLQPERRPERALDVSLSDRWYILGMTGSGKTTFAKRLMRELRGLYPGAAAYILDSKGGDDFEGWPGVVDRQDPPGSVQPGHIQVWRPPEDNASHYDAWLEMILKARRPAVVYIDELSSLSTGGGGTNYPPALAKLLKQGRSLGICLVILTQEAAYIPRQIRTQATHLVKFRLQDDEHGQRQAARLLGQASISEPTADYGFFYRRLNPKPGSVIEYDGHDEFF